MTTDSGAVSRARRRHWLAGVVAVALLLGALAGGWFLARAFESPAQRQANADPPVREDLWYPIKQGRLVDDGSGRGVITSTTTEPIGPIEYQSNAVVTAAPAKLGESVTAGSVVAEVNGAPVFAFAGAFPFYRNLTPGIEGPDVEQLQRGLRAAGFPAPLQTESGSYGAQTALAVRLLYQEHGYSPEATLPLTRIAVADALPRTVLRRTHVGQIVDGNGELVTLGAGSLVAKAPMDAGIAARMKVGMPATVYAHGRLIARAKLSSVSKGDGFTQVLVTPRQSFDASSIGRRIVVVVDIQIVARKALLVPSRSIVVGAEPTHGEILVQRADGAVERVAVDVLGELAGVSAIAVTDANPLSTLDRVRVG